MQMNTSGRPNDNENRTIRSRLTQAHLATILRTPQPGSLQQNQIPILFLRPSFPLSLFHCSPLLFPHLIPSLLNDCLHCPRPINNDFRRESSVTNLRHNTPLVGISNLFEIRVR